MHKFSHILLGTELYILLGLYDQDKALGNCKI